MSAVIAPPQQDDSTPVLRAVGALARSYSTIFAASPLAPLLSPRHPVRHSGFDLRLVVDDVRHTAGDVAVITLRAGDGTRLPDWTPGAHLEVTTPAGRLRHYSLCSDPADRYRYRIAVRRIDTGRGGSRDMHALKAGDPLAVRGPRNAFPLATGVPGWLFVAGGIGITPILPMVRAAAASRVPWRLVYVGRSRSCMPFLDELATLPADRVEILAGDQSRRPGITQILRDAAPGDAVHLCGPETMLAEALHAAPSLTPRISLHLERFTRPAIPDGRPFMMALRRSGHILEVGARESTLEAVRRILPNVAYSCGRGFCGTCRTTVLAGRVEHHDRVLYPDERADQMTLCVSRGSPDTLLEVDL
ncbi:MAG TPA: PDR/VanB family oxidoreductase [Rugosimonospora sp.]|nr:PDR/VanB family oxidoreductase [Rugosimonospora sp.]